MATENRSNNCKNQTSNRTSNQTTNSATNEHKHPNQYTKGADDESAKNSTSSRSSNAKNSRSRCPSRLMDHGREPLIFLKSQSPLPSGTVFQCGKQRAFASEVVFIVRVRRMGAAFCRQPRRFSAAILMDCKEEQRSMAAKRPFRRCAMIMKATSQVSLGSNCCHSVSNSSCTRLS